ncbi:hypothetical protein BRPE64_DCDS09110 (plasmid) [Caballeronia insecticola]|uniref:Uncharacterized protein n=1 Tax=Caballeronia insecticola TaxID=758793 RepID=R4X529_9BURK|nr:hypothetical protein BRPE64_DCDS09110 [Caballeronia insecticola]
MKAGARRSWMYHGRRALSSAFLLGTRRFVLAASPVDAV